MSLSKADFLSNSMSVPGPTINWQNSFSSLPPKIYPLSRVTYNVISCLEEITLIRHIDVLPTSCLEQCPAQVHISSVVDEIQEQRRHEQARSWEPDKKLISWQSQEMNVQGELTLRACKQQVGTKKSVCRKQSLSIKLDSELESSFMFAHADLMNSS